MILLLTTACFLVPIQTGKERGLLPVGTNRQLRPGLERALEAAEFGLPAGETLESLLRSTRNPDDGWEKALLGSSVLAPAILLGDILVAEGTKEKGFNLAIKGLLANPGKPGADILFARIVPWIDFARASELVDRLLNEDFVGRDAALALLQNGAFPDVMPAVERFLLSNRGNFGSPQVRSRILSKYIFWKGAEALEALAPILQGDRADDLVYAFLKAWSPMAGPEHLGIIWGISNSRNSSTALAALTILARLESDADARGEIFEKALNFPERNRDTILDGMIRPFPDRVLEEKLTALLDSDGDDLRDIARRLLPIVSGPEKSFYEFKSRVRDDLPLARQAGWMLDFSRLDWLPAQEMAAKWFAHGGWGMGTTGMAVARSLGRSSAIDDWLGVILKNGDIPEAISFPLAVARAPHSHEARAFLRQYLDRATPFRQEQILRGLSSAEPDEDLGVFVLVARENRFDSIARVVAFKVLANYPAGSAFLVQLLDKAPHDYQVLEGLVRVLVSHRDAEIRQAGVSAVSRLSLEEEESLSLQLAILEEQARFPRSLEKLNLAESLASLLVAEVPPSLMDSVDLPNPRRLLMEEPLVLQTALALSSCLEEYPETLPEVISEIPIQDVPLARLIAICPLLAESGTPLPVAQWMESAALRVSLSLRNRIRALAAWAHISSLQGENAHHARSLEHLLAVPVEIKRWQSDLAYGLRQSGVRGWVLPIDRLSERSLLVRARGLLGQFRLEALRGLLGPPAASFETLLEASELALECVGGDVLAFSLGRKAAGINPTDSRGWLAGGLAAAKAGKLDEANFYLLRVQWTALPGSPDSVRALEALTALGFKPSEF